jgi:hypothetical protein
MRKPIPNHPYHAKETASLLYIINDASAAAIAMRGVDVKAECKYLDQVNDAATILAYRRRVENGGVIREVKQADGVSRFIFSTGE